MNTGFCIFLPPIFLPASVFRIFVLRVSPSLLFDSNAATVVESSENRRQLHGWVGER